MYHFSVAQNCIWGLGLGICILGEIVSGRCAVVPRKEGFFGGCG